MSGLLAHTRRPESAFRPSCGTCGATFATKGEKKRHKLTGCKVAKFDHSEDTPCPPEFQYANMRQHITPEIQARADAEWAAMDDLGRLPEGWTYGEQG